MTLSLRILRGLPGAGRRASGTAFHWRNEAIGDTAGVFGDPVTALLAAFTAADVCLAAAIARADATLAPLLEAQRLMLGDPELRDEALARVRTGTPPATAVSAVAGELASVLEGAESVYFRERAIDIRAVGTLVAERLRAEEQPVIPVGAVVLAEELSPLDTARLAEAGIAALVTLRGGPTCHAAIIARAWGIPAVVGAPAELRDIPDGLPLLVDGDAGIVVLDPTPEEIAETHADAPVAQLARCLPVYANIGSPAEVARALADGAAGIGLLRTEFLFLHRTAPPSEDEQAELYAGILQEMHGRPVIIRVLDIGADKPAPFLPLPHEENPQLGLRGVRLLLRERALLRTQLRALLRAAPAGDLRIMLPMITMAAEMRVCRALLAEIGEELELPLPPLGAMIEVPMAALAAEELAAVSDFFSIGTNDLLQFLLAADRGHAGVGYLHAADHPAVWGLLAHVISAAHAAGIPAGICGEWGADAAKLARLADLGIDSVSVSPAALPRVRQQCGS